VSIDKKGHCGLGVLREDSKGGHCLIGSLIPVLSRRCQFWTYPSAGEPGRVRRFYFIEIGLLGQEKKEERNPNLWSAR